MYRFFADQPNIHVLQHIKKHMQPSPLRQGASDTCHVLTTPTQDAVAMRVSPSACRRTALTTYLRCGCSEASIAPEAASSSATLPSIVVATNRSCLSK